MSTPYRESARPKCTNCYGQGSILDWDGMGSSSVETCGRCLGTGHEPQEETPKNANAKREP